MDLIKEMNETLILGGIVVACTAALALFMGYQGKWIFCGINTCFTLFNIWNLSNLYKSKESYEKFLLDVKNLEADFTKNHESSRKFSSL